MSIDATEVVGYVASALIAVSLSMSNLKRLRALNLVGAGAFAVYGLLLQAWPVVVVNVFIVGINIRFLRRYAAAREAFERVPAADAPRLVDLFVTRHRDELEALFPDAGWPIRPTAPPGDTAAELILRDLVPAGLTVWRRVGRRVVIDVDYAAPEYRDGRNAECVLKALERDWAADGAHEVVAAGVRPSHAAYLLRVGFERQGDGKFAKSLKSPPSAPA